MRPDCVNDPLDLERMEDLLAISLQLLADSTTCLFLCFPPYLPIIHDGFSLVSIDNALL